MPVTTCSDSDAEPHPHTHARKKIRKPAILDRIHGRVTAKAKTNAKKGSGRGSKGVKQTIRKKPGDELQQIQMLKILKHVKSLDKALYISQGWGTEVFLESETDNAKWDPAKPLPRLPRPLEAIPLNQFRENWWLRAPVG